MDRYEEIFETMTNETIIDILSVSNRKVPIKGKSTPQFYRRRLICELKRQTALSDMNRWKEAAGFVPVTRSVQNRHANVDALPKGVNVLTAK